MKSTLTVTLVLLAAHLFPGVRADSPTLWGDLEAGPHEVGFRILEETDHSRAIRLGGSSSEIYPRPIRIYVWYPANLPEGSRPMAFGRYAELAGEDVWPDRLLEGVREMLHSHEKVLQDTPPRIRFQKIGTDALELGVFAYADVREYADYLEVAEDLNLKILGIVEQAGSTLALPGQTLIVESGGRPGNDSL